jgi:CHAT domain-containing protein/tetratricopeptide (TPR) repeat protein
MRSPNRLRVVAIVVLCVAGLPRPSHPSAESQDVLSRLESARDKDAHGEFREAEAIYEELFANLEGSLGDDDTLTCETAIGFAACLGNRGDYQRAETLLRRCLDATIRLRGDHTGTAGRLMLALADALDALGRTVESTGLYRQAALVVTEAYGPNHPYTASALSGLAHTKRRMGDSPGAEELYRRCIDIVERARGPRDPDLIHYRSRLGMSIFENRHDPDLGLRTINQAIAQAAAMYGEGSYQMALEERQAGLVLAYVGRYEEAHATFTRSLGTLERYYGLDHPYLSKCLKGLTEVCAKMGLHEQAYAHIRRAIDLQEHSMGRDEYELAILMGWKSTVELLMGAWDDAVATLMRAVDTSNNILADTYQATSSREAVMIATRPQSNTSQLIAAAARHPNLEPAVWLDVFSRVVATHGQVLYYLAERQRGLEGVADGVDAMRSEYVEATQRVVDLVIEGPGDDPAGHRAALAEARLAQENAERALSSKMEGARRLNRVERPIEDDQGTMALEALEPGATLVHYVHFPAWRSPKMPRELWREDHYGAFVGHKPLSGPAELSFVDLGPAAAIDSMIFAYRRSIDETPRGRRPTAREEAEFRASARALYDRVWSRLSDVGPSAAASSVPTAFVAPVLWLHLVDFNTLLAPDGRLVIERFRVHYLSSARDLYAPAREGGRGSGLLAVGNPTYSPTATEGHALCIDESSSLAPLPGAERETRSVAELFRAATGESTEVLLGTEATKQSVKEMLAGKRIAHFAAHGFFCDEDARVTIPHANRLVDPLLQSGLVLSNREGDGLLTAQELVCLDLHTLDWVVLSACGSGLGRLVVGEGEFGLRRAFEIAGTRTVVTTLWEIGDAQTRNLMSEIYRRRLEGATTVDAIRLAQLDRMRDQRRRLNRIHPVLWGGIVAEGDWR